MTLYEIVGDYMKLLELAEDPEVDAELIQDTMEAIEGELEVKAENTAKIIRQLEADAKALKEEEERFKKRRQTAENNAARLKKLLETSMKATGKTKFETELFKFRIQKNAPSVVYAADMDVNKVPAEFLRFLDPEIDKTAVKDALKNGAELTFAHLEQTETIRIQ